MKNRFPGDLYYRICATRFGPVVLIWGKIDHRPRVVRIFLTRPGIPATVKLEQFQPAVAGPGSCQEVDRMITRIRRYLDGWRVKFDLRGLYWEQCTGFQKNVLLLEHQVPRAMVTTYKILAGFLKRPGGARAVGNALAGNPFPLVIPCHRCIGSDKRPGGYQGGSIMKEQLLEIEGLHFDDKGRVKNSKFFRKFKAGPGMASDG